MKHILLVAVLATFVCLVAACTIDPVRPQEVYEATATARAEIALLPTVTPTPQPPAPTIEPQVLPEATVECLFKVNRSSTGELIYHWRGSASFDRVEIDPDKGEFCTDNEQEAIDAGARKALR